MDKTEKIKSLFEKGLKLIDENQLESAIEIFNEILSLDSGFYKAYSQRANSYLALGQIDNAIRDLDDAINIKKDDARLYLKRAIALDEKKMYNESIKDYSIVTENTTDKEILKVAYLYRGYAYSNLEQDEDALADFTKVIEMHPDDPSIIRVRATVFRNLKQFENSIKDWSNVLTLIPDDLEALKERAILNLEKERFNEVITDCEKAIKLGSKEYLLYILRGYAYNALQQYEDALKDFSKAFEIRPDDLRIIRTRANIYSNIKQVDNSIKDWSNVLTLIPEDIEALKERAKLYFEKTRFNDAISDCDKAIELNPNDSQLFLIRGGAFYEKGELLKAKSDLHTAKSKGNTTAAEMLKQIDKNESNNLYRMKSIEAFNVYPVDNDKAAHFFKQLTGNETFTLETKKKPLSMIFSDLINNLPQYSFANGFLLSISIDDAVTKTENIDKMGDFTNKYAVAAIKVEQGGELKEAKITVEKNWKSIYNKKQSSSDIVEETTKIELSPAANKKGCLASTVFVLSFIIIIIAYLL